MAHKLSTFAIFTLILTLLSLVSGCAPPQAETQPETSSVTGTATLASTLGVVSNQALPTTTLTRQNDVVEIGHANARVASNSVASTQDVPLIQDTPVPTLATTAAQATQTQTAAPKPTNTPTIGEMLKDNIVFYLIQPEKNRQDACGNIQLVPIISKRMRSNDKLYDVQVALNMLFNLKSKLYIQWYNALWDTDLKIDTYEYIARKDYMIINFAGYLPAGGLSNCDKHGIREQIWTTFFHYGIKEKTFKINGVFLIDQLNRNTK